MMKNILSATTLFLSVMLQILLSANSWAQSSGLRDRDNNSFMPQQSSSARSDNMVNMRDFGADDTGMTDVAPLITKALGQSKPVYFPCGTYSIRSLVNIPEKAQLYGAGFCAILEMDNRNNATLLVQNVKGVNIHDLAIMDSQDRKTDDIRLYHTTGTVLSDLYWLQSPRAAYTAVHIIGGQDMRITQVSFISGNTTGYGILIDGDGHPATHIILSCITAHGYLNGIRLNWASDMMLNNGTFEHAYGAGLSVGPDMAHVIDGHTYSEKVNAFRASNILVSNNQGDGIEFVGDGSITGTYLSNSQSSANGILNGDQSYAGNGLYVANPKVNGLIIHDSNFNLNYGNGILIENGQNIQLSASIVRDNSVEESGTSNAITIGGNASHVSLTDNKISIKDSILQGWLIYNLSMNHIVLNGNMLQGNSNRRIYALPGRNITNIGNIKN